MTPRELEVYAKAFKKRTTREMERVDILNHLLGNYIALGVNNPKKYPKKPLFQTEKARKKEEMSDEEMEIFGRVLARKGK